MEWVEWIEWIQHTLTTADRLWLLLGGLLLVLLSGKRMRRRQMRKMPARDNIPGYALLYADQKQEGRGTEDFGKLLYSEKYDLQGKPDYVFCSRILGKLVPVELKSGSIGEDPLPHRGDYLQLAAYFLILEDVYGKRPAYGRLVYRDYMFEIRNTRKVRKDVFRTMKEMEDMLRCGVGKPKNSFSHCRPCICSGTVCQFSETKIEGETEE